MGQYANTRRHRHALRLEVDNIVSDLADGRVTLSRAGRRLDRIGCPFAVACRVCLPYREPTTRTPQTAPAPQ